MEASREAGYCCSPAGGVVLKTASGCRPMTSPGPCTATSARHFHRGVAAPANGKRKRHRNDRSEAGTRRSLAREGILYPGQKRKRVANGGAHAVARLEVAEREENIQLIKPAPPAVLPPRWGPRLGGASGTPWLRPPYGMGRARPQRAAGDAPRQWRSCPRPTGPGPAPCATGGAVRRNGAYDSPPPRGPVAGGGPWQRYSGWCRAHPPR